jgi:hypothetical protein
MCTPAAPSTLYVLTTAAWPTTTGRLSDEITAAMAFPDGYIPRDLTKKTRIRPQGQGHHGRCDRRCRAPHIGSALVHKTC